MEEQIAKGEPIEPLELKAKFLDPLVEIINVHGIPREPQTLAFLVTRLALFPTEHQMTLKFMKQWSKKLDATLPSDQRLILTQAVCFFKLVSHPSDESFLKDSRLHDLLLDFWLDSPGPLHLFFSFLDLNPPLQARVFRCLFHVLTALEVKLGFLVEDHVPQALVFA